MRHLPRRGFMQLAGAGAAFALVPMSLGCGDGGEGARATAEMEVGERNYYFGPDATYEIRSADHVVDKLSPDGAVLQRFGRFGTGPGQLNYPVAVHVNAGLVYVLDRGNSRIQVFKEDGEPSGVLGASEPRGSMLRFPRAMVAGPDERLWVADPMNHTIWRLRLDGSDAGEVERAHQGAYPEMNYPSALAVAADGHVHAMNAGTLQIDVFDPQGRLARSYGHHGPGGQGILRASSIALDELGHSYVAEADRIDVYHPDGTRLRRQEIYLQQGSERVRGYPWSVAQKRDGSLYVRAVREVAA